MTYFAVVCLVNVIQIYSSNSTQQREGKIVSPKTKKKTVTKKKKAAKKLTAIRIDPDLWAEVAKVAELQGTSSTAVLAQCLKAGLPRLERLTQEFQDEVNADQ